MDIHLTDKALAKVHELATREEYQGQSFRVGVEGSTCSGFTYWIGFSEPVEGDTVLNIEGLKILVDPMSAKLLGETHIDYRDSVMASGFVVTNKKLPEDCGHGVKCRDKED